MSRQLQHRVYWADRYSHFKLLVRYGFNVLLK
jgi:hypothetical protein